MTQETDKPPRLDAIWAWMLRNPVLFVLTAGLVTLLLGWWGFILQFALEENNGTVLDALYLAIQLLFIRSGTDYLNPVIQLEVARYLGVLMITFSTLYIIYRTLHDQFRLLWLKARIFTYPIARRLFAMKTPRRHVVICGAGSSGAVLACHFQKEGFTTIVLEKEKETPEMKNCRSGGVLVLNHDARSPEVLGSVRVQDAAMVFALTGDDAQNIDIALACAELARRRPTYLPPLTCHIHIDGQNLSFALRELGFDLSEHDQIHFVFFNLFHAAGRSAARFQEEIPTSEGTPTLLIVGLGDFGKSLLVNLVKRWRETRREDDRITIAAIDRNAGVEIASLVAHFPALGRYCNLIPLAIEIHSAEFIRGDFRKDIAPKEPTGVYICLRDEGEAISVAIRLHNLLSNKESGREAPPIVIRTAGEQGMTRVVRELSTSLGWNIRAFPILTDFCEGKRYASEIPELLAEATHRDYLKREYGRGITAEENPSVVPWEDLSEDARDQNRAQAKSLIGDLREHGYRILPMRDWDEPYLEFDRDDPMILTLAIREHERYVRMKKEQGYRWGPEDDPERKINKTLVDWADLPDEEREKDIQTILELPGRLARVYFKIEEPLPEEEEGDRWPGAGGFGGIFFR
ncbi:MAG: hypothetical protein GX216_08090 [Methanomicrobiales archaeon]|nr:hypothetical protein [Methanomicrobiales archaeon]